MTLENVVPILIAARNEELFIANTLCSIVASIEYFRKTCREKSVKGFPIIVCDNNSTDNTRGSIQQFENQHRELLRCNLIHLAILEEQRAGKLNALKRLIAFVENTWKDRFEQVIFSDAEVEWDKKVFSALVTYKRQHPDILLVGSNIIPKNTSINLWGRLELLPYYGYGKLPPQGQGLLMKFVSGMGYLADQKILHYLRNDIPPQVGNEDVALSALVGVEHIGIVKDAIIRYDISENYPQFLHIRGRQIRESYQVKRWLREWELKRLQEELPAKSEKYLRKIARKHAKQRFLAVCEVRTIPCVIRYYTGLEEFNLSKDGIIRWLRSIPVFHLPLTFILYEQYLMFIVYTFLKIKALIEIELLKNHRIGWEPVRVKKDR